jgi:hypothetical protein
MSGKNEIVPFDLNKELSIIEQVVMQGDLSKLNPEQRVTYYRKVCDSAGLNPYTRPFDYISLNGKLTLYAKKDATEQLRKLNGISIERLDSKVVDDLYIVTAVARSKDGRTDQATGAVVIGHLKGDAKANAIMKAETKAKRRVTLSISGMGWTDETEIETIPTARSVHVDLSTGEIKSEVKEIAHVPRVTSEQASELADVMSRTSVAYQAKIGAAMDARKWNSYADFTPEVFNIIYPQACANRDELLKNDGLEEVQE